MDLNLTVEDLRLGRYESQRNLVFQNFVQKRAILNDPSCPPEFIRCKLLELMTGAHKGTGILVVRAERGIGKTTAAKFILKNSAGGIMFCNRIGPSNGGLYWKGVARAIGIPSEVYEKCDDWMTLMVKAVAAAENPDLYEESQSSWIDQILERFTSVCGEREALIDDSDPPSIEGFPLPPLNKRAVLVFDDFNDVHDSDIDFMRYLFPIVEREGVLAFVLVRDERTANRLVGLNGWGRIAPLEGICQNVSKVEDEKIPDWTPPEWTKAQLTALVRSRFGNVDLDALAIEDGENPFDLLKRAREL